MISISSVNAGNLPDLVQLLRAIAADESPDDPHAADQAEANLMASLAAYDVTRSDLAWILLAYAEGEPAGYAAICRIPKIDARVGFLFIDALHVLSQYRRRGVAQALLQRVDEQVSELRLHGIRLLTRPDNDPARSLYQHAGFEEFRPIFCQKTAHPT